MQMAEREKHSQKSAVDRDENKNQPDIQVFSRQEIHDRMLG